MSVYGTTGGSVLDVEGAIARFGGDKELFAEMAGYVFEDAPPLYAKLRTALAAEDASAVRMNAHALKGLVAGCGGVRAAQLAQSLENAGQASDLSECAALDEALQAELKSLMQALRVYLA